MDVYDENILSRDDFLGRAILHFNLATPTEGVVCVVVVVVVVVVVYSLSPYRPTGCTRLCLTSGFMESVCQRLFLTSGVSSILMGM